MGIPNTHMTGAQQEMPDAPIPGRWDTWPLSVIPQKQCTECINTIVEEALLGVIDSELKHLFINSIPIQMKFNTGAIVTITSKFVYD